MEPVRSKCVEERAFGRHLGVDLLRIPVCPPRADEVDARRAYFREPVAPAGCVAVARRPVREDNRKHAAPREEQRARRCVDRGDAHRVTVARCPAYRGCERLKVRSAR